MRRCMNSYVVIDDILLDTLQDDPIRVPYEVQQILYEMTLKYLIVKPDDPLRFCSAYMNDLRRARHTQIIVADMEPEEVLEGSYWVRRPAIHWSGFDRKELPDPMVKDQEDRKSIVEGLVDLFPFNYLDSDTFRDIVDQMYLREVESGECLTLQGEPSTNFYLIKNGQFTAFVTDGEYVKRVKSFENSGHFCELALMNEYPLEETWLANSMGAVWVLSGEIYRELVKRNDLARRAANASLLKGVPFLKEMSEEEVGRLLDSLTSRDYSMGELVMTEGDPLPNKMFVVEKGIVELFQKDPVSGRNVKVARIGEGGCFGEGAMMDRGPRPHSACAAMPTRLAVLRLEDFENLIGPCLQIMERNHEAFKQQMAEMEGGSQPPSNLR